MKHLRKLILAVAVCCISPTLWASGQSIRVRVVSTDTGNPLSGKRIDIERPNLSSAYPGSPQVPRADYRLKLKTNKEGWTIVELKQLGNPMPERLLLSVAIGNWTQCSPFYISVVDALRSGVVAENYCKSEAMNGRKYLVSPGEIVVFTRHISVGEKVKHFPQ
jgi:hypothetical protein